MGQGHSHRAGRDLDDGVEVGRGTRIALLAGLGVALVAAVVGIVVWWPSAEASDALDRGAVRYAAPGVTFPIGELTAVAPPCDDAGLPEGCGTLTVDVGDEAGSGEDGDVVVPVPKEVSESGLEPGDRVELLRTPTEGGAAAYSYFATDRDTTLTWLALLFLLVVVAVARWRGVLALVGLAAGGAVVWWFMLPALLHGAPGIGVALAGSTAIMFVVLYTTHGVSLRTSTALAGTLVGIALTSGLGLVAIDRAHLTGISDESGAILSTFATSLDFQSLLGCALVIAGLGVLNDVTITQASAIWELRAAAPHASRAQLFASGMRIGRDHIASTIYTIVFAYVGTSLLVLMLLQVYDRPLVELLSTEELAEEIVRTLTTSIGLVLAVPATTLLAAVVVRGPVAAEDASLSRPEGSMPAAP
ncbi:YibE/F family protein [Nocardioides sp. GY 10113]|uniref:YibE/F family protein n=1 Tax=Nocardioides sp. GY 10113 TaxID=2569761 RepID=UPI0010A8D479|nr:YibE/F family protein [Nocardioides sp. GY 10113]TIC89165.1 YibE/F family protein [Nocardioides sp. GY 10113]